MHRWLSRLPRRLLLGLAPCLLMIGVVGAQPAFAKNINDIVNHNGKCLDMTNGSTSQGAPAQIFTCDGFAQEDWDIVAVSPTDFLIVNEHSGLCLSILNNNPGTGAEVIQVNCIFTGADSFERWFRTGQGATQFEIANRGDGGLVMHPSGCGSANGLKIFMNFPGQCLADFWHFASS